MKKAIIWGHKLGTHTHSYVHNGFFRAFKFLGYDTHWFDDSDDVSNFDFSNSIFLTEGQVDKKIPLRNDCRYVYHNCDKKNFSQKYENLNHIYLDYIPKDAIGEKLNNYTYLNKRNLFQPWATDLLPTEIIPNNTPRENKIYFVGSVTAGWNDARDACLRFAVAAKISKNIDFHLVGGYSTPFNDEYIKTTMGFISNDVAIGLIRKSYLAPVFQSDIQISNNYIPCRIFKNISYGQYAITNNHHLKNFFDEEIIYNQNTYDLFFEVEEKKQNQNLDKLMQIVKEKHTYVNRIEQIERVF